MEKFPNIPKSVSDYLFEEEGNITRNKLLMVGSLSIVMGVLFALQADAGHGSHKSHKSHTSHLSSSRNAIDSNHISHGSSSHANQFDLTSHSNTTHLSRHSSHRSHMAHHSHSNHESHSNVLLKLQPQNIPVPQKIDNNVLPSEVQLSQIPNVPNICVPNVPDTVAPTFSTIEAVSIPVVEKE